jgi:hypothetical protein
MSVQYKKFYESSSGSDDLRALVNTALYPQIQ